MRRAAVLAVIGAIALAALAAAVSDFRAFAAIAADIRWAPLAAALAATLAAYLAFTAILASVAEAARLPLRFGDVLTTSVVSQAVNNQLSAGGVGGMAIRIVGFGGRGIRPGAAAALSVLAGFADDVALTCLLFVAAALLALHPGGGRAAIAAASSAAVAGALMIALLTILLRPAWREAVLVRVARAIRHGALDEVRNDFVSTIDAALGARAALLVMPVLFGFLDAVFRIACLGAAFAAVGQPQPGLLLVAGYGVGVVAGGVSMIPGGLGATEAGMVGTFVLLGVDAHAAIAASVVFRLAYFAAPLAGALAAFPDMARTRKDVRARAPGPRGSFLLGSLGELSRDPFAFYQRLSRDHGPLARFRAGPWTFHLVSSPELVRDVLLHDVDRWRKGWGNDVLRPLIGDGIFLAEGEAWKDQRKVLGPLFHRNNLSSLHPVVVEEAAARLGSWKPGIPLDAFEEMRHITLRIAARGLLGVDLFSADPALAPQIGTLWNEANRRVGLPAALWKLPLPANRRFARALRALDVAVSGAIRRHRADPERVALLDLLSRARSKDGRALTPRQIRDEAVTILLAGHECTSIALAWTLYLLASHPEVAARARAEVDAVCPGGTPAFEDLPRLHYLERVLDESMRLFPPAWMLSRQNLEPVTLGGVTLPRNSIVLISPWVLHRDPGLFEDPLRFDPDRFLHPMKPYSWIPFGGGPRACAGRPFAMAQATAILAMILARFRLEGGAREPVPDAGLTLRPRSGVPIVLRRSAET